MSALYPSGTKTFTPRVDNQDPVIASDVNLAYLEITAIENTLGSDTNNPTVSTWSGSFNQETTTWSTVHARITNIERGVLAAFNDRVKSSGGSTVANTSTVGLTLQSALLATGNLLEVKDSSGTLRTAINAAGYIVGISGGTP
jgi:hypothetical protein